MAATWNIDFEQLRVLDADEDGTFSDGDEPYIVAIGFRSKFNTPGSTQVFWGGMLDDEWAEHSGAGSLRAIPAAMGRLRFGAVDRPTIKQLVAGARPEIIGAVVIAFESDGTPFSAIRTIVTKLEATIKAALAKLVETGKLSVTDPGKDIQQAIAQARAALTPSTLEAIGLWLESFTDPDNLLGVGFRFFGAVAADAGALAPGVPLLVEQGVSMAFKAPGVSYEITGAVRKGPEWNPWVDLGATFKDEPGAVVTGGVTDVYVRGMDDALWQNTRNAGKWSGWSRHGEKFLLGSAPTVVTRGPGHRDVFVRSATGTPFHKSWTAAGGWTAWQSLGGTIQEAPAAVVAGPVTDVYARGMDDALWQKTWNGTKWSEWQRHTDGFKLSSAPLVVSSDPSMREVFVRGPGGAVWHKVWTSFAGWSAWGSLGGEIIGRPGAVISGGATDVYVRAIDSTLYQQWFVDGKWSGWHAVVDGGKLGSGPTVLSSGANDRDVFVRASGGSLQEKAWH